MSFVGGGSDLRGFYGQEPGAVLSSAVDKYIFVTVNAKFDDGVRVAYSKTEDVASAAQVEHVLVRASLERLAIAGGVEITTVAEIPSRGTGLGSSSAFTVGLLNALSAFQGRRLSPEALASEACRVEIDICGDPIGKQDQYAAAYGGFNLIAFLPDESVRVTPLILGPGLEARLEAHLLVFYTGKTRSASEVLRRQGAAVAADSEKRGAVRRMAALAHQLKDELEGGNLEAFGEVLHENWMLKRSLAAGISSGEIDGWYEAARGAGAVGGKILGAGGGGFLLLFAPPQAHAGIEKRLAGLRRIPMAFERPGSQIVFYDPKAQNP
jgi:D-glycero-alpha-D-manno-heptose-7-phosphate kinase